jgi:hypothetical protein
MDLFDIDGVVMQYEQLYGQVIKGERFDPRAIGLDYAPPLPDAA